MLKNLDEDQRSFGSDGKASASTDRQPRRNSTASVCHGAVKEESDSFRTEDRDQIRNLSSNDMPCKDVYEDYSIRTHSNGNRYSTCTKIKGELTFLFLAAYL